MNCKDCDCYIQSGDICIDCENNYQVPKQIAGNHYAKQMIEPIDYIMANKLGFNEGNVIKYVTRYKDKNGKEDILKAIHYLEFILKYEYEETR